MEHVSTESFYYLQSKVNILIKSVNHWLIENPNRRNLFIRRLSELFEKKNYDYACLGAAVWTGPNLYQAIDMFDGPYCCRAADLLVALSELLDAALIEFPVQRMNNFQSMEKSLICEAWLYDAVLKASEKMMVDQIYSREKVERQFVSLLEMMNAKKDPCIQAAKRDYSQECPVCKELSVFLG